jgi:hypothetical protein
MDEPAAFRPVIPMLKDERILIVPPRLFSDSFDNYRPKVGLPGKDQPLSERFVVTTSHTLLPKTCKILNS